MLRNNDVKLFPTVYRRIYSISKDILLQVLTLSNKKSRYKSNRVRKCSKCHAAVSCRSLTLLHGAISVVCDCGISWSFTHGLLLSFITKG